MKSVWMVLVLWFGCVPLLLFAQTDSVVQPAQAKVATVEAISGIAFMTKTGGQQTLLVQGAGIFVGDVINTTRKSTARIRFVDGGETLVRPESALQVQAYVFQEESPDKDNVLLQLVKGGMRAITGAVGKRGNPDAYQLKVQAVVVGIRGTDFSVRLCQQDCSDVMNTEHRNRTTPVAARVVKVRGVVKTSKDGANFKAIQEGQALYSGDTLQSMIESHAVLVFSDGTRITVNPSSSMVVAEYSYGTAAKEGTPGSMIIDMFKGGLRVATGLIGKSNPDRVKVRTATAVIGIRGTVFDLVCSPVSSLDSASAADLGSMPCDESLWVQTREGTTTLSGTKGDMVVLPSGQSGRVNGPDMPARSLQVTPDYFKTITTPEPENIAVNMEGLFGMQSLPETESGVLLTVHEGRVLMAQAERDVLLDAGESAFAGSMAPPVRLQSVPAVLERDPFLSNAMLNANMCRR